jgi:hypothetical protein
MVLSVAFAIGTSLVGLFVVRRLVPVPVLREHNDVAGFIFAGVAVIYAVILAFVVIAVWESYERDRRNVGEEATRTLNMYRESGSFSDSDRDALRRAIRDYNASVVDSEWPAMEKGEASQDTELALQTLWKSLHDIEPANESDGHWYQAAIDSLKQVSALREERLDASRESLPAVLTGLLIFGAAITIAYTYLYGVRNIYGQALMTAALAGTIGMAIALVLVLDIPFRGGSAISPEPFEQSLRLINHDLD